MAERTRCGLPLSIVHYRACRPELSHECIVQTLKRVRDDNPFVDGLLDFMGFPEGILFEQVRDITWEMLEGAIPDTSAHKLIWTDGSILTIEQSAQKIDDTIELGQGVEIRLIESEILGWLEMGEYQSDSMSDARMQQLERDVVKWLKSVLFRRNTRNMGQGK